VSILLFILASPFIFLFLKFKGLRIFLGYNVLAFGAIAIVFSLAHQIGLL
jgi:hypothetical protein